MTTTNRCGCSRPIQDNARLCDRCGEMLARALGDVVSLVEELETTITRQSRTGGSQSGVQSRAYERPLPWDENASQARSDLRIVLWGWTQVILEVKVDATPVDTLAWMSRYLLARLDTLRHHDAARDIHDEVLQVVEASRRAVDRHPERMYAGPCDPTGEFHEDFEPELRGPCTTDLYALPNRDKVTCHRCQLEWQVQARRDYLLDAAQDQLVTAADLSKFLTAYGEPVTAQRIWNWVDRGHLLAHGTDRAGRPTYRVGDAVKALADHTRPQRKEAS